MNLRPYRVATPLLIVPIQYIVYQVIPCHYILYQYQLQTLILFSKYTKRSRLITITDYSIYLYLLQQFFLNFFYLPFSRSSLSRRIVLLFLTTKILLSLLISVNNFLRIFGIFFLFQSVPLSTDRLYSINKVQREHYNIYYLR